MDSRLIVKYLGILILGTTMDAFSTTASTREQSAVTTVKSTSSGNSDSQALTTMSSTTVQDISDPTVTATTTTAVPTMTGTWSDWGSWSTCTVTCNIGLRIRYRTCIKSQPNSANCLGDYVEQETCTEESCPVYGKWDTWNSWGSCDVTCGGGTQTRTRICQKSSATDIDCNGADTQSKTCMEWSCPVLKCMIIGTHGVHGEAVTSPVEVVHGQERGRAINHQQRTYCTGSDTQSQTCSEWNCPDCSRICTVGTLNAACEACICESNTITGRVTNGEGTPLVGVTVARAETPLNILIISNASGNFKLDAVCQTTSLLFSKTGYQDATAIFSNVFLEINMILIEYPRFVQEPVTKYRLTNETVIMCCDAVGNPQITYMEWFKNGNPLHSDLYPNEKQLQLINVSQTDSGEYRCRANSPAGSTMSEPATLTVKDSPSDFCSTAYIQKKRSLPSDCVQPDTGLAEYEVGDCDKRGCRGNTTEEMCDDRSLSCCGVSGFVIETVQCTGYTLKIIVVKGCSCKACSSTSVSIVGEAKGVEDKVPLYYGEVYMNGQYKGRTSKFGYFSLSAPASLAKVTLTFTDSVQNHFIETTKVVNILEHNDGSIYVSVGMLKAAEPLDIDSTIESSLNTDPNNTNRNVQISLPKNAFYHTDGTYYNGTVEASFTYLDPSNITAFRSAPGVFQTINAEGESEQLQSLGVFSLAFKDKLGNDLYVSENMDVHLPQDMVNVSSNGSEMSLWVISRTSGKWEPVAVDPNVKKRKRRQAGKFWIGEITFSGKKWVNIDRIPEIEKCYFKIKVFEKYNLQFEVTDLGTVTIEKVAQTLQGYASYPSHRRRPQECFLFNCRQPAVGLIEAWYETSLRERVSLLPVDPNIQNLPQTLKDRYTALNYNLVANGRVIDIKSTASDEGPFFPSETVCKLDTSSSLWFYLPAPLEDVFTYARTFNVVDVNLVWNMTDNEKFSSDMAWYQDRRSPRSEVSTYRSCFMKIKTSGLNNLNGEKLVIKTTNAGGNISNVLGEIYGKREVIIDTMSGNDSETKCIEYKCSGSIGTLYRSDNAIDQTVVTVTASPPNRTACYITYLSPFLASRPGISQPSRTPTYTFFAPKQTQVEDGLFAKEGQGIATNSMEAEKRCLSGTVDVLDRSNPDLNVALTFRCEPLN